MKARGRHARVWNATSFDRFAACHFASRAPPRVLTFSHDRKSTCQDFGCHFVKTERVAFHSSGSADCPILIHNCESVRVIARELGTKPAEANRKPRARFADFVGCCRLLLFAVVGSFSLLTEMLEVRILPREPTPPSVHAVILTFLVSQLSKVRRISACSMLPPALLTCLDDFVQVRSRPYLYRSKSILKAWKL